MHLMTIIFPTQFYLSVSASSCCHR